MKIQNGQAKIWYGLHFYPGVAQYAEPNAPPLTIFINEQTIRSMGPSFAGRPVFVRHVDGVDEDIDEVRKDADGWVIESFFNEADGKHWVKFVSVTDRAEQAIAKGWTLSNAYFQKQLGPAGIWNGISYQSEILAGEYEHLAIVPDPRYEESLILGPDDFKKYNEQNRIELKRLANQKQGVLNMSGFSFFKKSKVDNAKELTEMSVLLPKSGLEMSVIDLIKNADEILIHKNEPKLVNGEDQVEVGNTKMKVNELIEKFKDAMNALADLKKHHEGEEPEENEEDEEVAHNDEDEDAKKKAEEIAEHEDKEIKERKSNSQDSDKNEADKLRNAPKRIKYEDDYIANERPILLTSRERVSLGMGRYGR